MYRCYLIHNGRIEFGYDINLEKLADAVAHARTILATESQFAGFSGIELWRGEARVYGDGCYADDVGHLSPVISPFQTGESTMFLPGSDHGFSSMINWWPQAD